MPISAQEAQGFQFGEGRKGYEERQVESFRQRVVETLRTYEAELARANESMAEVKRRVSELEDAEEAVKRTFLAASRTKKEMEEEARAAAERVTSEAKAEADRVTSEAATAAEQTLDEARREADTMVADARRDAESRRSAAEEDARRMLGDARRKAAEAEAHTQAEVERLERRLAQLRTAVGDLERRLKTFAEGALDEVAVVSGLIDLEAQGLEEIDAFRRPDLGEAEPSPEAVEQRETTDSEVR